MGNPRHDELRDNHFQKWESAMEGTGAERAGQPADTPQGPHHAAKKPGGLWRLSVAASASLALFIGGAIVVPVLTDSEPAAVAAPTVSSPSDSINEFFSGRIDFWTAVRKILAYWEQERASARRAGTVQPAASEGAVDSPAGADAVPAGDSQPLGDTSTPSADSSGSSGGPAPNGNNGHGETPASGGNASGAHSSAQSGGVAASAQSGAASVNVAPPSSQSGNTGQSDATMSQSGAGHVAQPQSAVTAQSASSPAQSAAAAKPAADQPKQSRSGFFSRPAPKKVGQYAKKVTQQPAANNAQGQKAPAAPAQGDAQSQTATPPQAGAPAQQQAQPGAPSAPAQSAAPTQSATPKPASPAPATAAPKPATPAPATPAPKAATPATPAPTVNQNVNTTEVPADPKPIGEAADDANWTLVFSDEFNGSELDTSVWQPGWYGTGITQPVNDYEIQCYDSDNVAINGGTVKLTFQKERAQCGNKTREYTSGIIQTRNRKTFTEGYFESRIKLPAGPNGQLANWPAFWISGGPWPKGGEIDILEADSGRASYNFHYQNGAGKHSKLGPTIIKGDYTGWHTYAVDWNGSTMTFYFDGVFVGRYERYGTTTAKAMTFNMAASDATVPNFSPSNVMEVDYVRQWVR